MDIYGFHILKLITTTIDIYCFILKIKLKIYITIYLSSYPNWKKYIKNFFLFFFFIKKIKKKKKKIYINWEKELSIIKYK